MYVSLVENFKKGFWLYSKSSYPRDLLNLFDRLYVLHIQFRIFLTRKRGIVKTKYSSTCFLRPDAVSRFARNLVFIKSKVSPPFFIGAGHLKLKSDTKLETWSVAVASAELKLSESRDLPGGYAERARASLQSEPRPCRETCTWISPR